VRRPTDAERAQWLDLAQRVRFIYGVSLQEHTLWSRDDVMGWCWIGGTLQVPAGPPSEGPERRASHASVVEGGSRRRNSPTTSARVADRRLDRDPVHPERVKEILSAAALRHGVTVEAILERPLRWGGGIGPARHAAIMELWRMPWRGASRPSSTQIGLWLRIDHSTVLWHVKKRV